MNWDTIIISGIVAIPPTIAAVAALHKATQTHDIVNSRMTEMLALTKKAATDAATLAEKGAQTIREADKVVQQIKKANGGTTG